MNGRRAIALVLLGMLAVAAAQGPPVDAAAGKEEWATEDGVIDEAAGRTATGQPTLLVPPTSTDGTIKFIHSMVASQADMVGEMVSKVNPNLHGPLMGLTTMMMAVQEQIPNILSGKPMVEPSSLVHEMFVKYANGTKTDSDLADISKGLDELFTHKFDADDTAKALDLINAKDLFVDKTPKPQLIANKTLNWTAPNVAAWTVKNFSNPLPYLAANTTKFGPAKVTKIDNITAAKYTTTMAAGASIAAKQKVWDANNAKAINPTPPELSQKGGLFNKELAMATAVGNAYKTKDPAVTPYPTDWKPGMTTQGNNFWIAANNQTKLLELDGIALGANKNITGLPAPRIKPINIYKDSQNRTLQEDANKLNLTKTAFPAKQGFDWLRPGIDALTSDPVGDAVAPALSYLEFRDPTLFGVSNSKTTVSTKGTAGAKYIFDPSNTTSFLRKDVLKYAPNLANQMTKVNLLQISGNMFQYRPCIFSESYNAAQATAELVRIRPELIGISANGANVDPMLIDINPHVIKVQAQGAQWNPDLINIEPYVISIAPRVNVAGKAVPKPWQVDRPGAPAKSSLFKSQGGFKDDPATVAKKQVAPPVGKPYV